MDRYENGKIYKLVDNTTGKMYIGSTCLPTLAKRLAYHRYDYNKKLKGGNGSLRAFDIIKNNDYSIVLLENYPCETKDQLLARERYYIENNECVNKIIPGRTRQEWKEANIDVIKEKIKVYNKKYKDAHRLKSLEDTSVLQTSSQST